jgi:hypothetical protein
MGGLLMFSRVSEHPDFWISQKSTLTLWLLGILSVCSFFATSWGTFELIQASFFEGRSLFELRLQDILVLVVAGALLAAIQLTLLLAVKICYSRRASLSMRFIAFVGYLTCLCITAGFGFGFWWKVIVSNKETFDSTRTSVELAGSALNQAAVRLDDLKFKLDNVKTYSIRKANEEQTRGNTCGPSAGIPGPRQRLRDSDSAKLGSAENYIGKKLGDVRLNIDKFQNQFAKLEKNDPSTIDRSGTNSAYIENLSYQLSLAVDSFNLLGKDKILKSFRDDLSQRAGQTEFVEGAIRFSCPDTQLSSELNGTVAAIDDLTALKVEFKKITVTQGSRAVAYALTRLKNTMLAVIVDCRVIFLQSCTLPPSATEIRDRIRIGAAPLNGETSEERAGLGRDDMLPLGFGVIVDVLILVFGYFRFRGAQVTANTREFLAKIDSCFRQIFNRLPTASERLLPIKAAVFDRWSGRYAAVPVDFRNYTSVRSKVRKLPRWARKDDPPASFEATDDEQLPTMEEAQYLDNVFDAFKQAGFVRLLGFWGKLFNFVTDRTARDCLDRQNSFFANAPSLKIYKFYPNAYEAVMEHFFSENSDDPNRADRWDQPWPGRKERGQKRDHFPIGYGHEP